MGSNRPQGLGPLLWHLYAEKKDMTRAAAETAESSNSGDAARRHCLLLRSRNPISCPFPRRLFDPTVSEIRHGDDHREIDRVRHIAVPELCTQTRDVYP